MNEGLNNNPKMKDRVMQYHLSSRTEELTIAPFLS